jgi:hypothetical protein
MGGCLWVFVRLSVCLVWGGGPRLRSMDRGCVRMWYALGVDWCFCGCLFVWLFGVGARCGHAMLCAEKHGDGVGDKPNTQKNTHTHPLSLTAPPKLIYEPPPPSPPQKKTNKPKTTHMTLDVCLVSTGGGRGEQGDGGDEHQVLQGWGGLCEGGGGEQGPL